MGPEPNGALLGPMGPEPNSHLCPAVWGALRGEIIHLFFRFLENYQKGSKINLRVLLLNGHSPGRAGPGRAGPGPARPGRFARNFSETVMIN
jgi:hypothetical protein